MSCRRYGFFGPQPMLGDAPQGTLSLEPEEQNYNTRAFKGPRSFTTSAMRRGTGTDIGLSGYQPFSKNEPYEAKNTVANHDFRPGKNPNRQPFLPNSNPQVSTGAASLYTTITWPDPHQDRPDNNLYSHKCDETCTPDYYHAKMVNKPDDRIKGHHPNIKTKPEGDINKGPHLRYCLKGYPGGILVPDGDKDGSETGRALSAESRGFNHKKYGHPMPFKTSGRPFYDNPYRWEPEPYNDNVNHPNYRSHNFKGGSFKAGKTKNDVFDPSIYSRKIKSERVGTPEDYKGPRQFPNTMDLPTGSNVHISGRESRKGIGDKFIPGGCVHHSHPTYVSAGPYEIQEYEAANTIHNVKDGIFLTTNPRERPKACARPRFQGSKY
ncbi:hypothetical protein GL50803_0014198 [Giardia duodenalis]|uniref:Uncharacterized protein n=1 Tax=Giardia intestinalis (strain ATCC 50803 / WB clone C6) TaxID=184922 RepID=D3KHD6_GIAIC|nr:hypothetical protein GL50803_0014198 [Giardia intestinalis]KAE8304860.1 hypothetical protein GL50803_0014198 [Giardia intestinalis]